MASGFRFRGIFASHFLSRPNNFIAQRISLSSPIVPWQTSTSTCSPFTRSLSTTIAQWARQPIGKAGGAKSGGNAKSGKGGGNRRRSKGRVERDPKVVNMLKTLATLSPPRIPPPLRMARNRHLRHWTIHRAWLLFRTRQRAAREKMLMQQYNSMHKACEALRATAGPGTRETGYLYRVAMEKKGVYGRYGVPIEYARPQTETPARVPWNHDWKR